MNFGGNRTEYVWSGDELVAETNVLGNTISQITRAGPLVFGEVRNGVAHYYDVDAYNSIIVGTLTDGTVSGRLSYRAFGQVRTATGSIQTPFRFNGYISDGGDELSSPSRYYSLSTGRFTSMDPAAPLPMDPISWNAYVGLGANPMTYIDPDGRIKILSNGTAMMSEWRGWLANRAGEVDRSWYGKATAAGVGVGNALIGITEFGLGGVNAIANASVVAHATVAGAVGLDTRFADNAASELMSTQAAAAGLYTTATTDAKYQAYDHAVSVGADAFGGNQAAIAHSSEFITSLALPSELGTVRLGAIEERAVALAGAMELELARVQAFNRAGNRGSSAPYVVQEGGNGGVIMCRDGCFVAGTPVLTAEGLKPIEHLQIGELVAAKNELTGATAWQRIENIFITHDREIWNLSFVDAAGIIEVITSTPNHPFALISGGWQDAAKLVPGDQIATLDGRVVRLLTSQMDPGSATTYNLMVAVDHTYFIGHAGLWVHNQVDCCPNYKGGPHNETRLPINDGLDSHHMPAKSIGITEPDVGPAIQMDPIDHQATLSNGNKGLKGLEFRLRINELFENGKARSAMAAEVNDARRSAKEGSNSLSKYNTAIKQMLEYAKKIGLIPEKKK